ncbi:general transcription factor II-I repeat domain-containing protein 2-like [Podarcis muralis]
MPLHKKRKIDLECRIFNKKWTHDYFFVELKGMPVCLICGEALSILKKANLQRHYRTKHIQYEEFQGQLREEKVKALKMDLHAQQGIAPEPRKEMDSVEQASFMIIEDGSGIGWLRLTLPLALPSNGHQSPLLLFGPHSPQNRFFQWVTGLSFNK